jgi:xanthine dehydrogenase accessory factor
MASLLDMRAVVVDDRKEWANRDRFPTAADVIVVDYEPTTETLAPLSIPMTPSTYVVITTWGYDLPALEQALAQTPAYIGLVASPTKAKELFKRMIAKGVSPEAFQRVNTPAGLDLGSETPAEVALAIMAEVLAVQRRGSGQFLREVRGKKLDALLGVAAGANG